MVFPRTVRPVVVSLGGISRGAFYFEIPWYVKATNIITLQGDDVIDYRVPTELSILLCFLVDLSNGFTVLLGQPLRGSQVELAVVPNGSLIPGWVVEPEELSL